MKRTGLRSQTRAQQVKVFKRSIDQVDVSKSKNQKLPSKKAEKSKTIETNSTFIANNPMTMECVVEAILKHLDTGRLKSSRFVCKMWNREAVRHLRKMSCTRLDFVKKYTLAERTLQEEKELIDLVKRSKYPCLLRSLNIENWKNLSADGQTFVHTHGPNLQELDFGFAETPVDDIKALHKILDTSCPNLKKLHIKENLENYKKINVQPFPELKGPLKLNKFSAKFDSLQRLPAWTEKSLISILKASPKLINLGLRSHYPKAILVEISQMNHITSNLHTLELNCSQVFQRFIPFFSTIKFAQLQRLSLIDLDVSRPAWEALLRNFQKTLKDLKVSGLRVANPDIPNPDPNNPIIRIQAPCPKPFLKTLELVPGLVGLTWNTSYKTLFNDLRQFQIIHNNLKYLKVDDVEFPPFSRGKKESKPHILLLRKVFPNLSNIAFRRDGGFLFMTLNFYPEDND